MDELCRAATRNVEGAVLCAVIDLERRAVLALHRGGDSRAPSEPDLLALARHAFEPPAGGRVEEVQLSTAEHHHLMKAIHGGAAAVVLVIRRPAPCGWGPLRALR
jgi:hypothetical protein